MRKERRDRDFLAKKGVNGTRLAPFVTKKIVNGTRWRFVVEPLSENLSR
jgi:hypothetical protein